MLKRFLLGTLVSLAFPIAAFSAPLDMTPDTSGGNGGNGQAGFVFLGSSDTAAMVDMTMQNSSDSAIAFDKLDTTSADKNTTAKGAGSPTDKSLGNRK